MRISSLILAGISVGAVSIGASASAAVFPSSPNFVFPDGSRGFALATFGGPLDPELFVDFNPQPDPPGFGETTYRKSGGQQRGGVFATAGADGGHYSFVLALETGDGKGADLPKLLRPLSQLKAPNADGRTNETFTLIDDGVRYNFDITLTFTGPGRLQDWESFNPQPDPPGVWFGSQFSYRPELDPDVTIHVFENGEQLGLTPAPEPATWALMLVGFGGLGVVMRSRRGSVLAA